MIETPYIVFEDAIRTKKANEQVYEGSPLNLDVNGELKVALPTEGVYGISKLDSNTHRDLAFGEFGAFGTGKLSVVKQGIVRVQDTVYNEIEIDTSMGPTSTPTTITLVANVEWAVGNLVYVAANGVYTNVATAGAASLCGKVTATPAMTGGWLEFEVDSALSAVYHGATGA